MLYQSDQKARELRPRACKPLKTHAPNEVPSHKKHLRQLGIQRKKGRGPSNYRVWKRKRRVIRSWGAAVCLSGSFLSLSNPLSPTLQSFFLSSPSLCFGRAPPTRWLESLALGFLTDETWPLCPGQGQLFSSADGRVWAPKKQQLRKAVELCECKCPRTGGFVALLKYRGPRREASVG